MNTSVYKIPTLNTSSPDIRAAAEVMIQTFKDKFNEGLDLDVQEGEHKRKMTQAEAFNYARNEEKYTESLEAFRDAVHASNPHFPAADGSAEPSELGRLNSQILRLNLFVANIAKEPRFEVTNLPNAYDKAFDVKRSF